MSVPDSLWKSVPPCFQTPYIVSKPVHSLAGRLDRTQTNVIFQIFDFCTANARCQEIIFQFRTDETPAGSEREPSGRTGSQVAALLTQLPEE
jgi:hypothetical protein